MSLCTDIFFYNALRSNESVETATSGRIFNTARSEEDDKEDRIPYIIIAHEGGNNDQGTKDDNGESNYDNENITVCIVADDRENLATLVDEARTAIKEGFGSQDHDEQGFLIEDYNLNFSAVQYDPSRPCFFQILTYQCETYNS